jgi:hypothetical protein
MATPLAKIAQHIGTRTSCTRRKHAALLPSPRGLELTQHSHGAQTRARHAKAIALDGPAWLAPKSLDCDRKHPIRKVTSRHSLEQRRTLKLRIDEFSVLRLDRRKQA